MNRETRLANPCGLCVVNTSANVEKNTGKIQTLVSYVLSLSL